MIFSKEEIKQITDAVDNLCFLMVRNSMCKRNCGCCGLKTIIDIISAKEEN